MASSTSVEIIAESHFKKVERSYFSTPNGWRLATFREARDGLHVIKEQNVLDKWDRVRLLDGWITGSGYDYDIGNGFRGCLGYMLLIQIESSSGCAYANVHISESEKEVALMLCADDWNYEVVYWLFNSWRRTERGGMDLEEVMDGRIPFTHPTKFKQMNTKLSSLARKLADNVGHIAEKEAKRTYVDEYSARDELSDMIKFVEENLPQYITDGILVSMHDNRYVLSFPLSLEPRWLDDLARDGGAEWDSIADEIWNFLSQSFAESTVKLFSSIILAHICKRNDEDVDLETRNSREENFIFASSILLNLSYFREDIIHAPLAHYCESNSCAGKMIGHVASECGRDHLPRLKQRLQSNAMWKCNDQIGNYDLLNKLLIAVAGGHASSKAESVMLVVKSLLDCGAQLGSHYLIDGSLTALEHAVRCLGDDDICKKVVEFLLRECDGGQQLVNTPNKYRLGWTPLHPASQGSLIKTCRLLLEHGAEVDVLDTYKQTPLHRASLLGDADTCRLLLENGAKLHVQDNDKKTPLHLAARNKRDVVDVFMKQPEIADVLDLKDSDECNPLDWAVLYNNIKLLARLMSKYRDPEAYFGRDTVDAEQLLRYSLMEGSDNIVAALLEKGTKLSADDCDDEGKTVLHLAAMCEDDDKAMEMVKIVIQHIDSDGKQNLVLRRDRRGRTALHEAALNGNKKLCEHLMSTNPNLVYLEDRDGRAPIYDAASGKHNEEDIEKLLDIYSKKDISLTDFTDRNGLTLLHVAASLGKKDLVRFILSRSKNDGRDSKYTRGLIAPDGLEYLKRGDFLGQTALHKAANCGECDTVEILLNEGAHPFEERDCDGRTALHYVVKAKTQGDKRKLIDLFLQKCKTSEEKWLFLWASAAGLGTADETLSNDDPLHQFLEDKKDKIKLNLTTTNLLKTATSVGNIEMTKELIARGYQLKDIHHKEWRQTLTHEKEENVKKVSKQLERISEQANDQPTVADNLGRADYAKGLAALLLNPSIKPPIVVGITGTWGMGKSSLMVQTESILLQTAAQMALLPYTKLSSSASELPEITTPELSRKGKKKYEEIKRYVDFEQNANKNLFSTIMEKILKLVKKSNNKKLTAENGHDEQDSLTEFLKTYDAKYRKTFKSLAAMDSTDMFTTSIREDQEHQNSQSKSMWEILTRNYQQSKASPQQTTTDFLVQESIPSVLTVQYNSWKYKNETEALAGLAVEITKELEGTMTEAQWLSTCCRNTWKKKKLNILIEIIYPCLLAVVLACTITWILWIILERMDKLRNWAIPKYACLPISILIIGWNVTKSIVGILKPVSSQLMSYISFPDHTDKLGYQERVISDITFLKDEIGKTPFMVFNAYSRILAMVSTLLFVYFEWFTLLIFHTRSLGKTMLLPKIAPAFGTNLRIIVFIEDVDRCQESVILEVLAAINLVLAVCEISVVLGIDKGQIERALMKNYGDMETRSYKDNQEIAEKYLQKIIQLPLDLPDPSKEQSREFLEGQLGVFPEPSKGTEPKFRQDADAKKPALTLWDVPETEARSEPSPMTFERKIKKNFWGGKEEIEAARDGESSQSGKKGRQAQQNEASIVTHGPKKGNRSNWFRVPITELLFVRYSKGEQDAFCYFQDLATESRKLPREWKRHLTYHRLVWYIFYLTRENKDLAGWQVQLITWIFICWEWRENMDFIIQNWNHVRTLKSLSSNGPSLQMIVEHFMELDSKDTLETAGTSHEKEVTKKTIVSVDKSSQIESNKRDDQEELNNVVNEQLSTLHIKAELDKLKQEIQELKDGIMKQQSTLEITLQTCLSTLELTLQTQLDKLKKEIIQEVKDGVMKQQSLKDEKREEEKRMRIKQWKLMKSALDKYDVSMDGIQAFQRFRFYCIAGHLSWHFPELEVQRSKNIDSSEDW